MKTEKSQKVQVLHENKEYCIFYHYFDNDLRIDNIFRLYEFSFYFWGFLCNITFNRKVKKSKLPIAFYNRILTTISKINNQSEV